jgi:hypothetical protein
VRTTSTRCVVVVAVAVVVMVVVVVVMVVVMLAHIGGDSVRAGFSQQLPPSVLC